MAFSANKTPCLNFIQFAHQMNKIASKLILVVIKTVVFAYDTTLKLANEKKNEK